MSSAQLAAMMSTAGDSEIEGAPAAEDADAPAAPAEGDAPATVEGDEPAEGKDAAPAKVAKLEDDPKFAAKFAALSRQQARVRELDAGAQQKLAAVQAREQELTTRHAAVDQRAAQVEEMLTDPEALFRHLESRGATLEKLQAWARDGKKGERLVPEVEKPKDPRDAPMTRADFERIENDRRAQSAVAQFTELVSDAEKYESANFLYSTQEMQQLGDRIARDAGARGIRFTLQDVADAVNEYAEKDLLHPKYKLLQKYRQKSGVVSPKTAAAAATESPDTSARKDSKGATLTNAASSERASSAPPRTSRETRQEKLSRIARSLG